MPREMDFSVNVLDFYMFSGNFDTKMRTMQCKNDETMIFKNLLVLSKLEYEKNTFQKNKRHYHNRSKA